jgi:glycosyltransferase involved in cell wall biosynthesis/SAM-dependent methyltransferase
MTHCPDDEALMARDTVLVITTSYPLARDGSEAAGAFVADFSVELATHLPTRVVGPGRTESVQSGRIPTWRFNAGSKPLSLLNPGNPLDWLAIYRTLRSLHRQVSEACADGRVKHIIALWMLPSGWVARSAAREHAISYSVWALGSDVWSLGKIPVVRRMLAKVGSNATLAFADGLQLARDAEALCGRRFEFLPSSRKLKGSRTQNIRLSPPYRLLFLGRWHPNKGIDLLLDALCQLSDLDWATIDSVHIAGGGPLRLGVEASVARLQQAQRPVRLSGFLDQNSAEQAFAQCDYVIIPSRKESIPVVFSDALQYGCRIIATPVGDFPNLITSHNIGVLADDASATSIAQAISTAVRMRFDANESSSHGDLRMQFDIAASAARFVTSIETMQDHVSVADGRKAWNQRAEHSGMTLRTVLFRNLPDAANEQLDHWHGLLLEKFLAHLPLGARVLDLACGYGRLTQKLLTLRPDISVVGQDIGEAFCQAYQTRTGQSAVISDLDQLPFKNDSFEGAIALTAFMYSRAPHLGVAVQKITNLVKPGGAILAVDAANEIDSFLAKLRLARPDRAGTSGRKFLRSDYFGAFESTQLEVLARGSNAYFTTALALTAGRFAPSRLATWLARFDECSTITRLPALHRWVLARKSSPP